MTDSSSEANDIDENAADVGDIPAPVDAKCIVVRTSLTAGVEIFDLQITLFNEIEVRAYDTGDGGEKDRVRGEICCELVARLEQIPRTHDQTDGCTNIATPTDVDVAR